MYGGSGNGPVCSSEIQYSVVPSAPAASARARIVSVSIIVKSGLLGGKAECPETA
jgi:hypothetical protein